jgi:hypothetical protein
MVVKIQEGGESFEQKCNYNVDEGTLGEMNF